MNPHITITKLDAAKRQLETAIRLHFTGADPVSAHTLAGAAYGLVQGVNANRSGQLMVKDLWQLLDRDDAEEFRRHISRAENFLKHADRDPDARYTLDTRWTEALLVEGSQKFWELTGKNPPLLALLQVWFIVCHPEILDQAQKAGIVPRTLDLSVFPKDRRASLKNSCLWLHVGADGRFTGSIGRSGCS